MYLQYTTAWPQARIDEVVGALKAGAEHPNAVKRLLARTVVDLYHGKGAGEAAEAAFDRVFKAHDVPDDIAVSRAPALPVRLSRLLAAASLVSSNREGTRMIGEGAVRVGGEVVREDRELTADEFPADGLVVQVGRRRWARVLPPE
jgi:tyrosyl-tRNA synthetase